MQACILCQHLAFIEFCILTDPPYVARSHTGALKCISSHFGDSFGKLALVHGNPFANQFDGFCLIWFICQVISDDPSVSLESSVVTLIFHPAGILMRPIDLRALQGASASIARSCPCCPTRTNKAAQALKLLFERCRRPKSGDPCACAVGGRLGLCQPYGKTPSYPERDHIHREKDDQASGSI